MKPLSLKQQDIVNAPGNVVVRASAGTGKTLTMVEKLEKEISSNHSHRVVAAITFTIKAAKEIRDRIKIDTSEHFIGTNNSFVIEEIIKPFAKDVYGSDYDIEMNTNYSIKKNAFNECLEYLRTTKTLCSYYDNKKNFVFELALDIVKKSTACSLYLKARYFKVYVDEYQDCDKAMHEFFMYLCEKLEIPLFVVGDDKQSIYVWRGANPESFRSLFSMNSFRFFELRDNFRSCLQIQNYSNILTSETQDLYQPIDDKSAIIYVETTEEKWIDDIRPYLDLNKECALLRYSNKRARAGAVDLSSSGTEFTYVPRTPISDITTDVSWLYNAIAQYFILQKYSVYDFMDEIPEASVGDRKIKDYLQRELKDIECKLQEQNDSGVIETVLCMAQFFGYFASEDHINKMIETIRNDEYYPAFLIDELSHVAITFHASKGLEYDQVIVFANDYALSKPEEIYNHYVAVTRAKTKLIIVRVFGSLNESEASGQQYCKNLSHICEKKGISPCDLMTMA